MKRIFRHLNLTDNTNFLFSSISGQLLIFYTIFYIVLAALFAICMQGLFATLDDKEPKWILDRSLIGTNPGMGFRPISNNTEEGSLIWYNMKNSTTMDKWIKLMNKFIDAGKNKSKMSYSAHSIIKDMKRG